ncbi:STREFT protein [Mycoplasma capricolum subsp. capripneumoniae]|uniref:STREFT protein n=1 Tax=Mycoplasma capricolum TaxID=2095 RepID=UPI001405226E|nr:STREFT protein [Mycoplasma capricolum]QIN42060.1 STREFT protein [Mycoplasma capricolum subsp. capripneumoniae]QIN45488.1 STREFT protein [Mycoplasma capricolum subsp. capripneumoniae]QIN47556.1 STREFT protein [Mycoplasma capricolum subsp. capripneumoniae]
MLKFIKNNKWWVTIISIFAIFFSSFGIFAKSYVDSNKQKIVNKIQNYVQASSYAVQSRILKKTENLNEDYLNQKIGKKSLLSEFNSDFIWRPNNSKTTSSDTISDLWKTYFGSSNNVLNKDLQIQYKNNNEYKNIDSSKGEITPKNIDFLLSISKSAEKFLNGFAPSLASLGLSFLQNKVLNNRDDPKFQSYKNGLNKFADIIENNKVLFSYLGKLLTPKPLEKDYYKDLTVQQALIKNINQIASVIADNKEFAKETKVDKLPEALDKVLADLGLESISEIIGDLINLNSEKQNIEKIFAKIGKIFSSENISNIKQKAVKLLNKAIPYLVTYLYSEIFFALYYTIHIEIKNPDKLLKLKINDYKFLALTKNKLDLNILLNGLKKVLRDKKSFERFYNFIFKRFDENKIFNNVNNIISKDGTGNLIIDIINWVESKFSSFISSLETLIKFAELAIGDENIRKIIETKIIDAIKTKLNELNQSLGQWDVKFTNDGTADISSGSFWAKISIKAKIFGNDGLISKLLSIIKKIKESLENSHKNIISQLKDMILLKDISVLDLSIASKSISEIIELFKNFLGDTKILNLSISFLLIPAFSLNSIYDLLELPYVESFLTNVVKFFAKDKIEPTSNKIKKISETLKEYKFINNEQKVKSEFTEYLGKLINHLKLYEKPKEIKFNLLDSFYNGNVISDIILKWINFLLQDAENKENPLLPIIRLITKKKNLETLNDIKKEWVSKITNISKKIENFENISKIRDTKIDIPKELLKHFGIENINSQTILQTLETIGKYFSDYSSKYPNRIVGISISSIGRILTALTTEVGVEYRSGLEKYNFMYHPSSQEDYRKTILKALTYGFDTHDNSSDVDSASIKNRKPESYYNWDKIHFYINGSSQAVTLDRTKLKGDSSYSPLHMLLGINPDKTSYLKDSLGYVLGTLFGGLSASDENHNLSIENKTDAISILNVFNYVLDKKDKELKNQEEQIATKYYDKSAWSTKILSSNENEITYELIRLKISDTKESKRLGTRFEVRLLKNKNNPYWSINRVIALGYKAV